MAKRRQVSFKNDGNVKAAMLKELPQTRHIIPKGFPFNVHFVIQREMGDKVKA